MTTSAELSVISIPELRREFNGRVIGPEDPGYDAARTIFHGGFDRRPAAIIRVADVADVARVISIACDTGLDLAVRSGGHSGAGHGASDGLVLDLTEMRRIDIDPERRTARAETGLTAGEYTSAAEVHGLATGFGDSASVGIGGITLGGGVGFLSRKHGLTIDSLLGADVVTASGELVRADAEHHPDLFWAIRGGGGNFGVVTRLEFRLHELAEIVGGTLILPARAETIAGFVAAAESAPEELTAIANVMPAPPMPFVPEEVHGSPVVFATLAYAGSPEVGERAVAPFRALAEPIVDMIRPMRYPELFPPEQPDFHPTVSARNLFIEEAGDATAALILERLRTAASSMAVAQLRVLGGAIDRVPADATAYAHRGRRIMANVVALHGPGDDRAQHEAWADGFADALRDRDAGAYVNFVNDEGKDRVRDVYPGETWERLRQVKRRYDPTNLFRLNQNIPPAEA